MTAIAHAYRFWVASAGTNTALYATDQLPAVLDVFGAGMLAAYAIGKLGTLDQTMLRRATTSLGALVAFALLIALLFELDQATIAGGVAAQYAWLNAHRALFALDFFALAACSFSAMPIIRTALHPSVEEVSRIMAAPKTVRRSAPKQKARGSEG